MKSLDGKEVIHLSAGGHHSLALTAKSQVQVIVTIYCFSDIVIMFSLFSFFVSFASKLVFLFVGGSMEVLWNVNCISAQVLHIPSTLCLKIAVS